MQLSMRLFFGACLFLLSLSLVVAVRSELRAEAREPLGRFPERDPFSDPLFRVATSDKSTFVYGPAKTQTLRRTKILNGTCPSINNQVCSGHGNCTRSSANVFGIALTNVRSHVCRCKKGWYGSGCHLNVNQWNQRLRLEKRLAKLFNSTTAKQLANGGWTTSLKQGNQILDSGSVFGRFKLHNNQPVPYTKVSGHLYHPFEPNTKNLDSWANPDEVALMPGARLLAKWERARLHVQIPVKHASQRSKFESLRAYQGNQMAEYTNQKGVTIIAPTIYKGQQGMVVRDETKPLDPQQPLSRDPMKQKLSETLNAMWGRTTKYGQPELAALT